MDWLALITGFPPSNQVSAGVRAYLRGVVVTQAVTAGASANQIIAALQGTGYGVRRQTMLSVIGQAKARAAASQTSYQLPFGQPASELLKEPAPAGWTGRYVHQVTATYRTTDEEGNYLLHTRTLGIISNHLLTPEQATAAALDIMTQSLPSDEEERYPLSGDILSLELSGTWYQVRAA